MQQDIDIPKKGRSRENNHSLKQCKEMHETDVSKLFLNIMAVLGNKTRHVFCFLKYKYFVYDFFITVLKQLIFHMVEKNKMHICYAEH